MEALDVPDGSLLLIDSFEKKQKKKKTRTLIWRPRRADVLESYSTDFKLQRQKNNEIIIRPSLFEMTFSFKTSLFL